MPNRARWCIGLRVTSVPSNCTAPSSGRTTPTTILNVVVLPAPFGPSNPTISPGSTKIETPSTTRRLRYSFTNLSVRTSDIYLSGAGEALLLVRDEFVGDNDFIMVPGSSVNDLIVVRVLSIRL